jgi:hypothetical protein
MTKKEDNIIFSLDEVSLDKNDDSEFDMNELLQQFENTADEADADYVLNNDLMIPYMMHYSDNFTIKELFLICDYYGISKELKANKCTKDLIVQFLVEFETNPDNNDIVFKRQNMWFYMNELKNDKFMKKYVLW